MVSYQTRVGEIVISNNIFASSSVMPFLLATV